MGRTNHPQESEVAYLDTGVRLNDREAFIVWSVFRDLKLRAGLTELEWSILEKCKTRAGAWIESLGDGE